MFSAILRLVGMDVGFTSTLAQAGQASKSFSDRINSTMFSAFSASQLFVKGLAMLKEAFSNAMHEGKQFTNLSLRLNIKPSEVMALSNYAKDSGVSLMVLGKSMQALQKFGDKALNVEKYKKLGAAIGASKEELAAFGRGGGQAMALLSQKMKQLNDETKEQEILSGILGGRNAMQMKQVLEQSPEEIKAGYDESYAASDSTIASANRAEQAMSNLQQAMKVAGMELFAYFEPIAGIIAMIASAILAAITIAINGIRYVYFSLQEYTAKFFARFSDSYEAASRTAAKNAEEASKSMTAGLENAQKLGMHGLKMMGASVADETQKTVTKYTGILATSEAIKDANEKAAKLMRDAAEWRMTTEEKMLKHAKDYEKEMKDIKDEYAKGLKDAEDAGMQEDDKKLVEAANKRLEAAQKAKEQFDQPDEAEDKWRTQMLFLNNLVFQRAKAIQELKEWEKNGYIKTDSSGRLTDASRDTIKMILQAREQDVLNDPSAAKLDWANTPGLHTGAKRGAFIRPNLGLEDLLGDKYMGLDFLADPDYFRSKIREKLQEQQKVEIAMLQAEYEGLGRDMDDERKRAYIIRQIDDRRQKIDAELLDAKKEADKVELQAKAHQLKYIEEWKKTHLQDRDSKLAVAMEKFAKATQAELDAAMSEFKEKQTTENMVGDIRENFIRRKMQKENPMLIAKMDYDKSYKAALQAYEYEAKVLQEGGFVSEEKKQKLRQGTLSKAAAMQQAYFKMMDAQTSMFSLTGDSLQAIGGGGNVAAGPVEVLTNIKDATEKSAEFAEKLYWLMYSTAGSPAGAAQFVSEFRNYGSNSG